MFEKDCKLSGLVCVCDSDYQVVWREICEVYCRWGGRMFVNGHYVHLPTCVFVFAMGMDGTLAAC